MSAFLRDSTTFATFTMVLDPTDKWYGRVTLAFPDLGLLWALESATIDARVDGSLGVLYDATGRLDRAAQLDLDYGSGTPLPV